MGAWVRTAEKQIARIASRQHGVVTRAQLLDAGVSRREIETRLRSGAPLRAHRGVFRVGHRAPSVEATYLAAVLAAGDGALLCGPAAAHLWGLLEGGAPPAEVVARTERRIEGIATQRSRDISAHDAAAWRGVPVTTVPRTLVDLAGQLPTDALARACHEAGVLYRTMPADVARALEKRPNARGAAALRRILAGDVRVTLSKLEACFLELCRGAQLPLPLTNRAAGGRRVDCRWPDHSLTVELDSYQFHNSRHAWEQDRRREREARARGDDFRRYTYGDVFERPEPMLRELHAFFAAGNPD